MPYVFFSGSYVSRPSQSVRADGEDPFGVVKMPPRLCSFMFDTAYRSVNYSTSVTKSGIYGRGGGGILATRDSQIVCNRRRSTMPIENQCLNIDYAQSSKEKVDPPLE